MCGKGLFRKIHTTTINGRSILLGRDTTSVYSGLTDLLGDLGSLLAIDLCNGGKGFRRSSLHDVFTTCSVSIPSTGHFVASLLRSEMRRNEDIDCVADTGGGSRSGLVFAIAHNFSLLLSHCRGLYTRHVAKGGKSQLLFCIAPFSSLGVLLGLLSVLGIISFAMRKNIPSIKMHIHSTRVLGGRTTSKSCRGRILRGGRGVFRRRVRLFQLFFNGAGLDSRRQ